ncbi:MAG: (Fe-S)-binding protein [Archaeoglobaceae archaeon]|nr:(Fe-S)-binding protein [Archaeoglobaceae archaeon]MDW8127873.1 4Fe-4S dicluster domain-containing protein [Archaeoglobaceae archaeon]
MSYEILMEKLGFPRSELMRKILEYLMDEESAKVASLLPGTVKEIAKKIGMEEEKVRRILEDLFVKGVVIPKDFKNREFFRFARNIVQLHDASLASEKMKDPEYAKLWKDFIEKEAHGAVLKTLIHEGRKLSRVVPAYNAIKDLPDVLPHENIKEMLKAQKKIAVVPCSCRNVTFLTGEGCRFTKENAEDKRTWKCIQVGRGAEYVIERGVGIEITVEEALKLIDEMEKDGLVHMWPNTAKIVDPRISVNCNCCADCCENFISAKFAKVSMNSLLEKSRYEAFVETEKCNGCQTCIERCHFDAIELYRPEGSKKFKAKVIAEKCFGCGVCVIGCKQNAIKLKAVRPPEFIPD